MLSCDGGHHYKLAVLRVMLVPLRSFCQIDVFDAVCLKPYDDLFCRWNQHSVYFYGSTFDFGIG